MKMIQLYPTMTKWMWFIADEDSDDHQASGYSIDYKNACEQALAAFDKLNKETPSDR